MPAVPAIIMGGAAIGSSLLQSRAAGKAAQTQERGADRALDLQREMYERGQASLAPYQQAGAGAVGTLAGLMGLPMGGGGGFQAQQPLDTGPTLNPNEQRFMDARNAYLGEHGRGLVNQFRANQVGREAVRGASAQTASSYGGGSLSGLGRSGRPSGGSRMVLMIGPDGDREQIPEAEVPELERMGARRA